MTFVNWKQQYENERSRLVEALGEITSGGIVEAIQHIGATSVPGLNGSSCVDIALGVWPFPLEEEPISRLEALGYQILDGFTTGSQQRFRHTSGTLQLFVFESGIGDWFDTILIRDYLRHNDRACAEVSAAKRDSLTDNSVLFAGLLPEARQWWIEYNGFSPVELAASEFKDAPFEWYVSGGWALDLFLEKVHRVHHDVDVIVPRRSQLDLQKHLTERDWKLMTSYERHLEPWPPHMRLELPRHQIHAHREGQFIDILLTDMDDVWRYRREPSILRDRGRVSLTSNRGIPYLAPELVLLFKSKNTSDHERPKDQPDFERACSKLEPERRAWLYWALMATSPDHPWIRQLLP
jgi:GrpB-like predicted nucleotidyltransferase (UPF0157 family)